MRVNLLRFGSNRGPVLRAVDAQLDPRGEEVELRPLNGGVPTIGMPTTGLETTRSRASEE